ncbi:MAG TPA: CDGSH iron-sulfur domain-containing protein [Alphaproteobacteria bacterium]|nr:CDGSH iron-sulfur domain-containing protein [Alphaproteobacteria bacterium]
MASPTIAQRSPYAVEVEAGKPYFWCACGQSKNQPFCDGSHKGTEFAPVAFKPAQSGQVFFCGCKHSSKKPMCDGTHAKV